jgi:hypothetical protein
VKRKWIMQKYFYFLLNIDYLLFETLLKKGFYQKEIRTLTWRKFWDNSPEITDGSPRKTLRENPRAWLFIQLNRFFPKKESRKYKNGVMVQRDLYNHYWSKRSSRSEFDEEGNLVWHKEFDYWGYPIKLREFLPQGICQETIYKRVKGTNEETEQDWKKKYGHGTNMTNSVRYYHKNGDELSLAEILTHELL